MSTIFGVPTPALYGQILIGLINGSFYAMLSLGLAVIFGLLRVINFAHGAHYMLGAFAAYLLLAYVGIGYWPALLLAPLIVGLIAVVIERTHAAPPLRRRPALRPSPHLRPRPRSSRARSATGSARPASPMPPPAQLTGARQSRLHVPADLPRLGGRRLARRLPRHLASHREDAGSAPICAPPPRTRPWSRPSA